eukprot:5620628-Prymnesium_polylepis.1
MKPATPETMRRRRSPARPRPTRGVVALDLSFDEPTQHVDQHSGHFRFRKHQAHRRRAVDPFSSRSGILHC